MPETIKVKPEIYDALDRERLLLETSGAGRLTFSDTIKYLIDTQERVRLLLGKLGPLRPDRPGPGEGV